MTNAEAIKTPNQEAIKWLREAEIIDLASGNTKDREVVNMAIKALEAQEWIPCKPSELPKDKKLWVTHDSFGYRYVTRIFWDMTGWNDNVSDVVAYMSCMEPEPYQEEEDDESGCD